MVAETSGLEDESTLIKLSTGQAAFTVTDRVLGVNDRGVTVSDPDAVIRYLDFDGTEIGKLDSDTASQLYSDATVKIVSGGDAVTTLNTGQAVQIEFGTGDVTPILDTRDYTDDRAFVVPSGDDGYFVVVESPHQVTPVISVVDGEITGRHEVPGMPSRFSDCLTYVDDESVTLVEIDGAMASAPFTSSAVAFQDLAMDGCTLLNDDAEIAVTRNGEFRTFAPGRTDSRVLDSSDDGRFVLVTGYDDSGRPHVIDLDTGEAVPIDWDVDDNWIPVLLPA